VSTPLITDPGAYPDVDAEDYHGGEICDGPSISSSGVKLITSKSLRHYWYQSNLNPDRPPQKEKRHFALGRLLHDILLLPDRVRQTYHVLPAGFSASQTKKWEEAIQARDYAISKGKTVLRKEDFDNAHRMAESVSQHELACALLTAGTPEITLAAKDPITGVWMRARPDVLPTTMEIIPDVKTAADASADVYERAATRFGYFQSAAFYLDVIEQLYGEAKRRFVLITIEKEPPFEVVIDHLDDMDIDFARMRNRKALNQFAEALKTGVWPGYTPPERPIRTLQMTAFERGLINQAIERGELSYA
jgi:hypothetical protein